MSAALFVAALTFEGLAAKLAATRGEWQAVEPRPDLVLNGGALAEPDEVKERRAAFDRFAPAGRRLELGDTKAPDLPPSFDWRDHRPVLFSPVTAQGLCSGCVAFAVAAALEAQLALACGDGPRHGPLSPQYLLSCGGGSCRSGWRLSEAVAFATTAGVPDEACFPYEERSAPETPCIGACGDHQDRLVRGVSAERPTAGFIDVADVKRALKKGPLVSSMILFDDLRFYGGGVYRHVAGEQLGSHAIVLVGWKDEDRAWIARNSWGDAWGDHGYFEVAWDDASLPARYTWLFDVRGAVERGACSRPH